MVDVVDAQDKFLGYQVSKKEAHEKGLWHRCAHIWIYTKKGELLIQLRSKDKEVFPNCWDVSTAGHITAGESPLEGAIREGQEEIGLNIDESKLELWSIRPCKVPIPDKNIQEFYYVYTYEIEEVPKNLKLQAEEVADYRFTEISKLKKEFKSNPEKFTAIGYWSDILEYVESKL